MNFVNRSFKKIYVLKRTFRIGLILVFDFILLSISSFLTFLFIYDLNVDYGILERIIFSLFFAIIGIIVYASTGQYKSLTRYVTSSYFYKLIIRNILLILLFNFALEFLGKSYQSLFWLLLCLFSIGSTGFLRFFIRDVLSYLNKENKSNLKKIVIYGAGSAGYQLATSLKLSSSKYKINFFVDDDMTLWNSKISGFKIYSPEILGEFKNDIDQIFLAIPSMSPKKRRKIYKDLQDKGFEILVIPSISEMASGRAKIDSLRPIQIEDLLSRNAVASDPRLLGPGVLGRSICVTGAGGSIGSEICKQLVLLKPKKLILVELCEHNLYQINKELCEVYEESIEIIPILGNCSNFELMANILRKNDVEVLYHCAAYKHVPLVEINPIQGILNNVQTTKTLCELTEKLKIKEFILLSSDKAVRPTSIMGVSKRVSELIVQAFSEKVKRNGYPLIKFSMVRFGNVLGSSGSVVPLFKQQIAMGGPVSITHNEVTRFFMTIKEAAQLVLQAAVLSKGGEVFLLDMGEPIKILNLAEQMINLSGKTIKKENNPDGDIEIVITGLRPGEKLYEELLIDAKSEPTIHPLIYKAKEKSIPYEEFMKFFNQLEENLLKNDFKSSYLILEKLVPEWQKIK